MAANTYADLVPEVWGPEVLMARNAAQILSPTVMKPVEETFTDGDTVNFAVNSAFTVGDANDDGTDNTLPARTFSTVPLVVDKHKYAGAHYSKKELRQISNNYGLEEKEQLQLGTDLNLQIETDLYNTMVAGAGATLGTQGAGVTDTLLKNIVKEFDDADVPAEDRWLLLNPDGKQDILGIDKFVKANEGGPEANALLRNSQIGKNYLGNFYGLNIIWSTIPQASAGSPAGFDCVAYYGGSVGQALQQDVEVSLDYNTKAIGWDLVGDTLYGHKVLRSTEVFKVLI